MKQSGVTAWDWYTGTLDSLLRRKKTASKWREQQEQRNRTLYAPKSKLPLCGAKTRAGGTCKARVVRGMVRCRMHGGLSTGPKTEAGRERIRESNRRRAERKRAASGE